MPFITVALAGSAWFWRRGDETLRTVSLVLAATFLVEFLASCKGGSGDYYFLSLGIWSILWIGLALNQFNLGWSLVAATIIQLAAISTVLFFKSGYR